MGINETVRPGTPDVGDESLLTGGGVDRVEVAWTVVGKEGGKRNGLRGGDEVVRLRVDDND